MSNDEDIDTLAKCIWDYHHVQHDVSPKECVFVLGSNDIRVAEYGAKLFLKGYGETLLISGGVAHNNDLLNTGWGKPEAHIFADVAREIGVPTDKIIIESSATNTGDNFSLSREVLRKKGLNYSSFVIVQKPYMERRAWATGKKQWPDAELVVTSPPLSYEEFMEGDNNKIDVINIMVGDLQRIKKYGEMGFQIKQCIPNDVWASYEKLVKFGFDKHLMAD